MLAAATAYHQQQDQQQAAYLPGGVPAVETREQEPGQQQQQQGGGQVPPQQVAGAGRADTIAAGLQKGGQVAAAGVMAVAGLLGAAMHRGAEAAVARMRPADKPVEVSAETQVGSGVRREGRLLCTWRWCGMRRGHRVQRRHNHGVRAALRNASQVPAPVRRVAKWPVRCTRHSPAPAARPTRLPMHLRALPAPSVSLLLPPPPPPLPQARLERAKSVAARVADVSGK